MKKFDKERLLLALAGPVIALVAAIYGVMALGAAYVDNALAHPHLYRTMFDATSELEDPAQADETFQTLMSCAARARLRSGSPSPGCSRCSSRPRGWPSWPPPTGDGFPPGCCRPR